MRVIEIIRTHKWERVPNTKFFRSRFICTRCGLYLDIKLDNWDSYKRLRIWGIGVFMNCNFNEDISKKHSCTHRIMEQALR